MARFLPGKFRANESSRNTVTRITSLVRNFALRLLRGKTPEGVLNSPLLREHGCEQLSPFGGDECRVLATVGLPAVPGFEGQKVRDFRECRSEG